MGQFIGCDAHKLYSLFVAVGEDGGCSPAWKVSHTEGAFEAFLAKLPEGSEIALEACSSYYWMVAAMERTGHHPHLAHPLEAKRRMGKTHKTDKLDASGLGILLRNGTLPEVWIPPAELRDQRELLRLRMQFVQQRTRWKNRIHGALTRYNVHVGVTDAFGVRGREQIARQLGELPGHTRRSVEQQLAVLDFVERQIEDCERRLAGLLEPSEEVRLLRTLPCVGPILSAVLWLEIGDVNRFPDAPHLASYAGLVPRVRASGGHTRLGPVGRDVNHHLKWAFVEAANLVAVNQRRLGPCHVLELYQRLKKRKNHQKAVVAVGRHLAEAAYWILKKREVYREPKTPRQAVSSTHG
jgi:transposase